MTILSAPSVRRKTDSAKIKLRWQTIAYKLRNVRTAKKLKKSMELLRRKRVSKQKRNVLEKLLERNVAPAVVGALFPSSGRHARPMSDMESVSPTVFDTRPAMTWVRNNNLTGTRETRKIVVPARRPRPNANPYSLDNRRVWTRKETITENNRL